MTPSIDPELRTSDFDYELPPELIAQEPLAERDGSRLLVLNRETGEITHAHVRNIGQFLQSGDVVVANNSKVIAARLAIRREPTGGNGEVLLLRQFPNGLWEALAKPASRLRNGETVTVISAASEPSDFPGALTIEERLGDGRVLVRLIPEVESQLESIGQTPLPPYITKRLADSSRYQTIYASGPGSAAAPTAGLHFSQELIGGLTAAGVLWTEVTLHIGLDTFRPVTVERVADHKIHSEWCTVSSRAAETIALAKREGRRVVALGTTAARTLETAGQRWTEWPVEEFSTDTSIFITPGFEWRIVDAMMTNFHLPRSTLLMMISAFAGRERVLQAYQEAIAERYRFFSFGDATLIL